MSYRRFAGLRVCMEALGVTTDGPYQRLIAQKAIYLFQAMGHSLGYWYVWYLRGPYSPALARDIDYLKELEANGIVIDDLILTESAQEGAKAVRDLLGQHKEVGLMMPEWAELLASVHYQKHVADEPTEKTKETILAHLLRENKRFCLAHAEQAWASLDALGLIEKPREGANESAG